MNIIDLAKRAGLTVGTNISGVTLVGSPSTHGLAHISIDEMERFASLVLEEAANTVDAMKAPDGYGIQEQSLYDIATMEAADVVRALKGAKE